MRRLPATCGPNKPNYYLANLGPLWHSLRARRLAKTLENRPQQRAQGSQNNRTLTQCKTIGHKSIGGYMHWANCSYCCRYNQWITPHRLTTIYGDFEHENPHGVQKGQLRWQSRNATAAAYKLGEGGLFPQSAFMLQPQHATPPLFLSLTTPMWEYLVDTSDRIVTLVVVGKQLHRSSWLGAVPCGQTLGTTYFP